MNVHWVWSDNPTDWAQQGAALATALAALFTGLAALFTGVYTLLTFRLMRFTALTARSAVQEIQRQRVVHLVPLLTIIEALHESLSEFARQPSTPAMARLAAVMAEEKIQFAKLVEGARYLFEDRNHVVLAAQKAVESANRSVQAALVDRHDLTIAENALNAATNAATSLSQAAAHIEDEIASCRRGLAAAAIL